MNLLYPNFLRRIDHYLKINYPHVWRTRAHDFGWFSLLLGNVAAVVLGVLVVGYNNVPSESSVSAMHVSLGVLLAFVSLFWAMRLLRFKIKFSNFKTMLTTWVIYVLCVASLGLNLAVFTSSMAYRVAALCSSKIVQAHYDYLNDEQVNKKMDIYYFDGTAYHLAPSYGDASLTYHDDEVYFGGTLKEEFRTKELEEILSQHGYQHIMAGDRIFRNDIDVVKDRLDRIKEAHFFTEQPFIGKHYNYGKSSFYHEFLEIHWAASMLVLFFLPTLLFLLSAFGIRNVLISVFSTILLTGLMAVIVDIFDITGGYGEGGRIVTACAFTAFILMLTLIIGKQQLQSWNYIAGVFMLMLAVIFFAFFMSQIEYRIGGSISSIVRPILPVSLMTSLLSAWMIARHNDRPILH